MQVMNIQGVQLNKQFIFGLKPFYFSVFQVSQGLHHVICIRIEKLIFCPFRNVNTPLASVCVSSQSDKLFCSPIHKIQKHRCFRTNFAFQGLDHMMIITMIVEYQKLRVIVENDLFGLCSKEDEPLLTIFTQHHSSCLSNHVFYRR